MSETSQETTRRDVLRTAGAAVVGGAGAVAVAAPASAAAAGPSQLRVRNELQLVDDQGSQRFLAQTSKPPVFIDGETLPPSDRGGPDHGTYLIFNDENESEKGGITVSSTGAGVSFDYPNVEAISLQASYQDSLGGSSLSMRQMPDPSINPLDVTAAEAPMRVVLGTDNAGDGSLLFLYDSKGNPRIALQVDGQDVPTIKILDANGNVVAQLPESKQASAATASTRRHSLLRAGSFLGRFPRVWR